MWPLLISFALSLLVTTFVPVSAQDQTKQSIAIFFALPLQRQHEEFRTYTLEKQYEIFIYSMQRRHPADLSFAYDIASKGQAAADFLSVKLQGTNDEWTQENIIYVFEVMAKQKYYSVGSDRKLITQVRRAVTSMKRTDIRENSERSLKTILDAS